MANSKCKECGCVCSKCISSDHDVHLHVEIENLKQRLLERDDHILNMETNFLNEANKFPKGEIVALREELLTWQDKYKRLYEAHRRVQRVNQGLEDKLLKLVDVCETDKSTLTKDVATLSHKLADANYTIKKLTEDNERYKNDVALAIQFLQCKPGNFVSQKVDSLPNEVQAKVSSYMASKRKPEERRTPPEIKSIKVPIPTFPPTAMVYSIPKSPNANKKLDVENAPVDIVSAAIMAKVLEERERERSNVKHCDTCTCSKSVKIIHHNMHHTVSTQTGEIKNSLCVKCSDGVEQAVSAIKIIKNVENIKNKTLPIYIHDYESNQNVAKVQPNNFLTDNKHVSLQSNLNSDQLLVSTPINISETTNNKPTVSEHSKTLTYSDTFKSLRKSNQNIDEETNKHHHLCDFDPDDLCAKDVTKGPRYCSMRLQSGSKNILLDNTHNNIAPILYRRHQGIVNNNGSVSSGGYKKSTLSESSFHNQRVAEWIENNMDVSNSANNSRSDSLKSIKTVDVACDIDKEKYAQMEKNVKRFLFGESEFLKTVEIGKRKYQSFRVNDKNDVDTSNNETET